MQQGSWSEDMQQEEHQGPRTLMCPFETLRRGPWLRYGKANVYVQISNKKAIKKPAKLGIIFVTHGPSPRDLEWIVFLVKGGSRRFPLVHIFAWNA